MLMSLNEERSTRVKVSQFLCRVELVLDANLVLPHSVVSGRGLNVVVQSAVHAAEYSVALSVSCDGRLNLK